MTNQQIKLKAISVIEKIITLKANVKNGCVSDIDALETESKRLEGIKTWAIENDMIQDIRYFLSSRNFGQTKQFAATELAIYFNN